MSGHRVEFVKSVAAVAELPREGLPEIALAGPSNVGKSSLLNSLLGRKGLARVSRTPGRTRLLNFFRVAGRLFLVDLPGYGFAHASRADRARLLSLTEAYLTSSPNLTLVIVLLDCRRDPSERDHHLRGWLQEHGVPFAVAVTKVDKLGRGRARDRVTAIRRALDLDGSEVAVLGVSSLTGEGRKELWRLVEDAAAGARVAGRGPEATGGAGGCPAASP